jgi:hypothetical protein
MRKRHPFWIQRMREEKSSKPEVLAQVLRLPIGWPSQPMKKQSGNA